MNLVEYQPSLENQIPNVTLEYSNEIESWFFSLIHLWFILTAFHGIRMHKIQRLLWVTNCDLISSFVQGNFCIYYTVSQHNSRHLPLFLRHTFIQIYSQENESDYKFFFYVLWFISPFFFCSVHTICFSLYMFVCESTKRFLWLPPKMQQQRVSVTSFYFKWCMSGKKVNQNDFTANRLRVSVPVK